MRSSLLLIINKARAGLSQSAALFQLPSNLQIPPNFYHRLCVIWANAGGATGMATGHGHSSYRRAVATDSFGHSTFCATYCFIRPMWNKHSIFDPAIFIGFCVQQTALIAKEV